MVILPGVPLAAFAVATGAVTLDVIDKSSAKAGAETPASNRQANRMRLTKSSSATDFYRVFAKMRALGEAQNCHAASGTASDKPPRRRLHSIWESAV
jgi:hypothetical protein